MNLEVIHIVGDSEYFVGLVHDRAEAKALILEDRQENKPTEGRYIIRHANDHSAWQSFS